MGQELRSPEDYFGYDFGKKFHFHSQVVEYARYVTQANPENTRLLPYGRTSEGRELLVVAFGSAENIQRLEQIRKAHLQEIGLEPGKPDTPVPVIAMLSYNIHGNEAVNTEVALQMMYELGTPGAEFAEKIFKSTVVLIDPCANPDGFDRYSQWYNRHVGKQPNADPQAIEHREPWPGGRFNHYHFDMNRDLAWQTQAETRQRVQFYNAWMPHFHGDFHEMGPGSSYFFAPSAKPFHEDFTPFQRQFQELIGAFHKREFDEKGWLYYTRQNFDLLYPSYGDTYPSYNGAIAMTYEQGGSGVAGLALARTGGDTLTLGERMAHSRSTGLAALEAVTVHAPAVKEAFVNYFAEPGRNGHGTYKSFVMKGRESDIRELTKLLDRLDIRYSYGESRKNLSGFRYATQRKESFSLETNDLVVNTYQAKGVLTKILFEPHTMLEDSNTYDITAWALPYVYGLEAYGVEQKVEGGAFTAAALTAVVSNAPVYAYALPLTSFESYRFLAAALQNGLRARVQPQAFEGGKKSFPAGTVVFVRENDPGFEAKIKRSLDAVRVPLEALFTGMVEKGLDVGFDEVRAVDAPKIGLLMGTGVSPTGFGEVWHFLDQELDYPVSLLDNRSLGNVDFSAYDVLVFPSGRYSKEITESQPLRDWVNKGGRLILLEGACEAFAGKDGFEWKVKQEKGEAKADLTRKYGEAGRKSLSDQVAGAVYEVKLDNTHPLAYGYGESMYLLIKDNNTFQNLVNGWNVGLLGEYKSGFVGNNAKKDLKDVTVFGVEDKGRGKVIYLTESPIFRGFWHSGKALFSNALFFVK